MDGIFDYGFFNGRLSVRQAYIYLDTRWLYVLTILPLECHYRSAILRKVYLLEDVKALKEKMKTHKGRASIIANAEILKEGIKDALETVHKMNQFEYYCTFHF